MNIRWRLGILVAQLIVLLGIGFHLEGKSVFREDWFAAGLLSVVLGAQLWEPFFSRPVDIISNGLIFLFFYIYIAVTGFPAATRLAWHVCAVVDGAAILLAVDATVFGLRSTRSFATRFANGARIVTQVVTAKCIYSVIFVLCAIAWRPNYGREFWILICGGGILVAIGSINWQAAWSVTTDSAPPCAIEGSLGPSILMLSAVALPITGTWVRLERPGCSVDGVVLNRVRRGVDYWAMIHVMSHDGWEQLASGPPPRLTIRADPPVGFIGAVDAGSSDKLLTFVCTRPLEIGGVVSVRAPEASRLINYQIVSAEIQKSEVKNWGQLITRVTALQLGIYNPATHRLERHRWVPPPGAAVIEHGRSSSADRSSGLPPHYFDLGRVIGTDIPVYLDTAAACEGHLVILGMTKMGKTTLALRLARALAGDRNVTILDQTGEWVSRQGLNSTTLAARDWNVAGLAVFEPSPGEVPADRALAFFRFLLERATQEYRQGHAFSRVIVIDEAHQFIPEPAGLGFQAPGRESSFQIGLLMMQIRKYGLSVCLISQRTAVVAKSALSQCENLIAFRSVDQTGLDYLEAIAGSEVRSLLPQLKQGEALVFGPAITSDSPVAITLSRLAQAVQTEVAEAGKSAGVTAI